MDIIDEVYQQVSPQMKKYTKPKKLQATPVRKLVKHTEDGDSDWQISNNTEAKPVLRHQSKQSTESFPLKDPTTLMEPEDPPKSLAAPSGRALFKQVRTSNRPSTLTNLAKHSGNLSAADDNYNPSQSPPDWEKVMLHAVDRV